MKKLLGIVVLSLLLSGSAFAEDYKPKDLEVIEFKDPTTAGIKSGDNAHPVNRENATRYCAKKKKFAYQFESTANVLTGNTGDRKKTHRYFCSRENLRIHPILGNGGWWQKWGVFGKKYNEQSNRIFGNYSNSQKKIWDDQDKKTTESKSFSGNTKNAIMKQCLEFGFKEGTEKFADCQLKLFMMQNQNSNNTQDANQNSTIIIQSENSSGKRKIDPSVWDDLGNLSKDLLSGKSVSDSLGGVSSSSSSSSKIQCFKSGERVSGTNKICSYNCMGSEVTTNVASTRICPLSIDLN